MATALQSFSRANIHDIANRELEGVGLNQLASK